ncbi:MULTISPECIES: DUF565 domain-containing protein [Prochlorococcus]|uniref:DUF565 domain-containing protein n=1 Tax=Prochlorococcus TaxID=1218 RepID=UPI000561C93B|nr:MULTISPECIES: DUF565 domain-containing protein [Prochlorococcus]
MSKTFQRTGLNKNFSNAFITLELWAKNPWRRYSLISVIFLGSFALGSSLGMINGVLAMMDPVGAFFTVVFLELLVRLRMIWLKNKQASIILQIIDSSRIGLLYGLFMEGFKLL